MTSSARLSMAALLLGATISLAPLGYYFGGTKTNFENAAALGAETTSLEAKSGKFPILCGDSRNASECLLGFQDRRSKNAALWLGNSQVTSVNQWQPGETVAVPILFDVLKRQGLDLLTFAQPNASLQEHYVFFEYLRQRLPVRLLLLPVVFDDLREEGVRPEVAEFVRDKATATALSKTETGKHLVPIALSGPTGDETAGISNTVQERVERDLGRWLESNSRLWTAREEIRGKFFVALYRMRNALFGINPSTKRKMIPGRYRANLAALEAILESASNNGIRAVIYVAPLRPGVETPYVAEEYALFKSAVEQMAVRPGVIFKNLEDLVPEELWGTKDSTSVSGTQELDFMHFGFGGHKVLAARLASLAEEAMAGKERR